MLVWVDIENEPQVQYLVPLVAACRELGAQTFVTARDYGSTFELLEQRGEPFEPVGAAYGASKRAKINGLLRRTSALKRLCTSRGRPDSLICASRAGVLAARRLGVQSYVISDYEYANLTLFRWAQATILHPEVIDGGAYRRAGFAQRRLVAFRGLKEDITFTNVDLEQAEPQCLAGIGQARTRVLLRPPAEESHYYSRRSRTLYLDVLAHLAPDPEAVVVFVPRYPRQVLDLDGLQFANDPVILDRPENFVSLLSFVDLVLCSGGTMLREAAYLGIPAYSIFGSEIGAVDRYLESIGRVELLSSTADLGRIAIKKASGLSPLRTNPGLVEQIAAIAMRPSRSS